MPALPEPLAEQNDKVASMPTGAVPTSKSRDALPGPASEFSSRVLHRAPLPACRTSRVCHARTASASRPNSVAVLQ